MSIFQKLFRQTFIYGLATVLPRVLSVILVPLYVNVLLPEEYGIYAGLMAFIILGNILLSYGMETAFFRFFTKQGVNKQKVQATTLTSLTISSLAFLIFSLIFNSELSYLLDFKREYIVYGIWILTLDALVVLPFVWFRANEKPMRYAVLKIINVVINLGFNLFFFLILPIWSEKISSLSSWWMPENKVAYIFISNLIASAATLLMVIPVYAKIGFGLHKNLLKQMIRYAFPVLISGIAFSINEAFDRILLKYLLPADIAETELGLYSACYKLGMFMTLFVMAFRLGIEPFFFNYSHNKDAKKTYALITKYFTFLGSGILLFVIVYIDFFKILLIPNSQYWEALKIVPLILAANLFLGIYHNLAVWYKVTDRTKYGAYISIVAAIITLIANFLLIPKIGYVGSAIATFLAYGSMMLLSYFYGQKYYVIPYNIKKIGTVLITALLFSTLSFYVFRGNIFIGTIFVILFLGGLIYVEKTTLKQILNRKTDI